MRTKSLIGEKGTATLVSDCQLIDPITRIHGYIEELERYQRGSARIDFILYTLNISEFVPYNMIVSSDHRGLFIDINIKSTSRIRLMMSLTI